MPTDTEQEIEFKYDVGEIVAYIPQHPLLILNREVLQLTTAQITGVRIKSGGPQGIYTLLDLKSGITSFLLKDVVDKRCYLYSEIKAQYQPYE